MLLAPVGGGGSAHESIEMPVPLRASPFEGSLADLMADHAPPAEPAEATQVRYPVVEKVDDGTSPLVFEDELAAPTAVQTTVEPEAVEAQEEEAAATSEKAVSPMVPPTEAAAASTTEKAVSPVVPAGPDVDVAAATPQVPARVEMGTSPLVFSSTPMPLEVELVDAPAEEGLEAQVEEPILEQVQEFDDPAPDQPAETAEKGISPMAPPSVLEDEEDVSPASTVKPLPTRVDVACETEPVADDTAAPEPVAEAEPSVVVEPSPMQEAPVPTPLAPTGVSEESEETDEAAEEVSPASTVRPLPAKIDVGCGTEPVEDATVAPEPVVDVEAPAEEAPAPAAEVELETEQDDTAPPPEASVSAVLPPSNDC
ncbi:uncharacterized protein PHACADRAFT_255099 [Phanerochaete carnosa HHB-10118-sp]|uniref:Uncharacterized protein n=1 Tax=Phanerochaete carnosa (strain HHB-10118-sp) TaxID=650164 RepID=K5V465_PHACS|nr:uncharacterized protein PHACADRAFT_255099 [Phanerochaete carnosa HHB-10118-sp]EKM57376.1 hypothetical protein PHACADRAFT_255099 [Phanerochaete carnosa HHB-10118-sp]